MKIQLLKFPSPQVSLSTDDILHLIFHDQKLKSVKYHLNRKMSYHNVNWKMSENQNAEIVFYNLPPLAKNIPEIFIQRLKNSPNNLLIMNRSIDHDQNQICIEDEETWDYLQSYLLNFFYPAYWLKNEKKIIGITGTNGKTTTAYLAQQIANLCGVKALYLGTVGLFNSKGEQFVDEKNNLTTPHKIDLHKILYHFFKDHDVLFMEVSSHALEQKRISGMTFFEVAWTNFTQDHLDYHKTMDDYFLAKLLILNYLREEGQIHVPEEEKKLYELLPTLKKNKVVNTVKNYLGDLKNEIPFFLKLHFNQINLSLALHLNQLLNLDLSNPSIIQSLLPPPGRFEVIRFSNNSFVIIDSAHTPDAFEKVVDAARLVFPKSSIQILFGCGGDRDRTKRPLMGAIAQKKADKIIVTSDNPRTEPPETIIEDILRGTEKLEDKKILVIVDRKKAIFAALKELGENQILLLLGKGHENYQITGDKKTPFFEKKIVLDYIRKHSVQVEKKYLK